MNEKTKQLLLYGLYISLISIAFSIVIYAFDLAFINLWSGMLIGIAGLILNIFLLVLFGRKFRNEFYNGVIKYGSALKNALFMVLVSVIISGGVYNYVFNKWIAPDYQEYTKIASAELMEERLGNMGMSDDDIDKSIEKILERPVKSAEKATLQALVPGVVFGLIFSLIAAAFVKKNPDPFAEVQESTDEIETEGTEEA